MLIKEEDLRKLIRSIINEDSTVANSMNTINNQVDQNLHDFVSNMLLSCLETIQDPTKASDPSDLYIDQLEQASEDFFNRLKPLIMDKIVSLSKEVLDKIKGKEYLSRDNANPKY